MQEKASFIFSFLRSSAGVMISRIFGLIRDVAIATVFGANAITDIFFVALAIPNLFREFFVEGAMSSAFMPFLAEKYKKGGLPLQNLYISQLVLIQVLMVTVITLLVMVFAKYVLMLFLRGEAYYEDPALLATGVELLYILMPFLILISIIGLFSGFLNIHRSYFISYASSALFNIGMIIGAWLAYLGTHDIRYLAYGVMAGGLLQLIVIYIAALSFGYRPRLGGYFKGIIYKIRFDSDIKKTYLLMVPSLAGVGISQLNFVIGRILTSYLQVGSISWLFYANRLFHFPLGVFAVTLGVVSLTELSKARADNDLEKRNAIITKALISICIIIIPATIGLVLLSKELVIFIFSDLSQIFLSKASAFDELSINNTSSALIMYSLGLIFFALTSLFIRVFHSEKNTKTPVYCAFISFIAHVILSLILMQFYAHNGIALASSLAALINALMLFILIKDYKFKLRENARLLLKILSANIILIVAIIIFKELNIHLLINIALCIMIYFIYLYSLRVNILKLLR